MKAAVYARLSTPDQHTENQLMELRHYVTARRWSLTEYVDEGISGTKESRPMLDKLLKDARRRKFDALVVWRLDRLYEPRSSLSSRSCSPDKPRTSSRK
jgi:DNA invertase Pin-like site-specific DNA recombinase